VLRARKLQRYLSQPFYVTAALSGIEGTSVSLADTLADCDAFLAGHYDEVSEEECYMRGSMERATR
jgi:F-type H+-transporting ATPase subunit beta